MSYMQKRGKNTAWRQSLMRNLMTELILHEQLKITEARAKELRKHVDRLITWAKEGSLASRRLAKRLLRDIDVTDSETILQKLFNTIGPRYKKRAGGYTQIIKLYERKGDNAPIVLIKLV